MVAFRRLFVVSAAVFVGLAYRCFAVAFDSYFIIQRHCAPAEIQFKRVCSGAHGNLLMSIAGGVVGLVLVALVVYGFWTTLRKPLGESNTVNP